MSNRDNGRTDFGFNIRRSKTAKSGLTDPGASFSLTTRSAVSRSILKTRKGCGWPIDWLNGLTSFREHATWGDGATRSRLRKSPGPTIGFDHAEHQQHGADGTARHASGLWLAAFVVKWIHPPDWRTRWAAVLFVWPVHPFHRGGFWRHRGAGGLGPSATNRRRLLHRSFAIRNRCSIHQQRSD